MNLDILPIDTRLWVTNMLSIRIPSRHLEASVWWRPDLADFGTGTGCLHSASDLGQSTRDDQLCPVEYEVQRHLLKAQRHIIQIHTSCLLMDLCLTSFEAQRAVEDRLVSGNRQWRSLSSWWRTLSILSSMIDHLLYSHFVFLFLCCFWICSESWFVSWSWPSRKWLFLFLPHIEARILSFFTSSKFSTCSLASLIQLHSWLSANCRKIFLITPRSIPELIKILKAFFVSRNLCPILLGFRGVFSIRLQSDILTARSLKTNVLECQDWSKKTPNYCCYRFETGCREKR